MPDTSRLVLVLALCTAPAFAQKIYVDYDRNYDFTKVETFAWASMPDTSLEQSAPLVHSRIMNSIEHHLSLGGLTQVEQDPDIWVTYHTSTKDQVALNTTNFGYGYGAGWYWGGAGLASSTTNVYTYARGTLLVDIWDAKAKEIVWRGSATSVLAENPEKRGRQIEKSLDKIVARWQRMREGR